MSAAKEARSPPEPEHRQISAFFCDMVGSSALANKLDPEDFREILRKYQDAVTSLIERHQGFVARYVGDGILAYFGFPDAHEDDAEQAVRSALEVVREAGRIEAMPKVPVKVRIGIATGTAIVGDVASAGHEKAAAIGPGINLAARLQEIAEPDGIIIDTVTRRLAGDQFNYAPLGALRLKGFDQEVAVWRVVGEAESKSRFFALRHQTLLTPVIGRQQELAALKNAWNRAASGAGVAVAVKGEAGIGKSRLVELLLESVPREATAIIRSSCSSSAMNVSLRPIITTITQAAAIAESDTAAQKLDKLTKLLTSSNPDIDPAGWVAPFAELLSITTEDVSVKNDPVLRSAPLSGTPEQQRERILSSVVDYILALAKRQPLLLLFEDVHWIDPSTKEVVQRIARRVAEVPLLLVLTVRSEEPTPWINHLGIGEISLTRLDAVQSKKIVAAVAGNAELPATLIDQIVERGDGIPLFLEELTRAVKETGPTDRAGFLRGPRTGTRTTALPPVLLGALIARLDHLHGARSVAQVCAAVGKEFPLALVIDASGLDQPAFALAVEQLGEAGLVEPVDGAAESSYRFRHALFQDAAYATLLRQRRQEIHARIAASIEQKFQYLAEREPNVLAHHFTEAGQTDRATLQWQRAGRQAASRAFHVEAASFFGMALELLPQLPEGLPRVGLELQLQLDNALSIAATRGYAAPEVERGYVRSREICQILGNSADLYPVIRGLCTFYIVRANTQVAEELAKECLAISETSKRPEHKVEGHTALGYVHTKMGKFASGRDHMTKAVELYKLTHKPGTFYGTSQDPAVACLSYLSHADWITGHLDLALSRRDEALRLAETIDPFSLAYAHSYVSMMDNLLGKYESAEREADRAIAIGTEHGFLVWLAVGTIHRAIARGNLGDLAYGIEALTTAVANFKAGGAETELPFFLGALSDLKRRDGDIPGALRAVDEAIDQGLSHGEGAWLAMLHAKRGRLLAEIGRQSEVVGAFSAAVSLARQQGATQFEMDATRSLREFSDGAVFVGGYQ